MATIPDSTASSLASSIISSLGTLSGTTSNVGSNLNISALVTQLVAADRAAPQAQITRETNSTMSGIAAAINSAPGNTGVQATILTEQGGAHLVLTASQTGAASAITVTTADSGLAQLNYNATTKNLTQLQAAQDSHVQIAMFDHYSATNTVSDAVTGVTFNLQSAVPGTTATVSVTPDTSGTASLVSSLS